MKTRLAMLDFVLSHLEYDYFQDEAEKVQYFEHNFQIRPHEMPGRTYRGANKVPDTIRYFEGAQCKILSAASGVAYEETRHLSRP